MTEYCSMSGLEWLIKHNPTLYYFGPNHWQDEFASEVIDEKSVVIQLCIRTRQEWDKNYDFPDPRYPKPVLKRCMKWKELLAYYYQNIAFISDPHEPYIDQEERIKNCR